MQPPEGRYDGKTLTTMHTSLASQVPQRQFELAFKMFDTDGNGRLDHREFKQVRRQGGFVTDKQPPDRGTLLPCKDHGAAAFAHSCRPSRPIAQGRRLAYFQALVRRAGNVRCRRTTDCGPVCFLRVVIECLDRETLSYEDFCAFRRDLQQEILRIQISFSPRFITHTASRRPRRDTSRMVSLHCAASLTYMFVSFRRLLRAV